MNTNKANRIVKRLAIAAAILFVLNFVIAAYVSYLSSEHSKALTALTPAGQLFNNLKSLSPIADEADFQEALRSTRESAERTIRYKQLLILSDDGRILFSDGESYIAETEGITILVAPEAIFQPDEIRNTESSSFVSGCYIRPVVLLKDETLLATMPATDRSHETEAEAASTWQYYSQDTPHYADYFPALTFNQRKVIWYALEGGLYIDGDVGYVYGYTHPDAEKAVRSRLDSRDPKGLYPTADIRAALDYMQAMYEMVESSDEIIVDMARLENMSATALLIWDSAEKTPVGGVSIYTLNSIFGSALLFTYPLHALLLAVWVFLDAQSRSFKPALWASLTLLGNVVILLLYLMLRPEASGPPSCPACQGLLRPEYAFCPDCGKRMQPICSSCRRRLKEHFHFCPYCGEKLEEETETDI